MNKERILAVKKRHLKELESEEKMALEEALKNVRQNDIAVEHKNIQEQCNANIGALRKEADSRMKSIQNELTTSIRNENENCKKLKEEYQDVRESAVITFISTDFKDYKEALINEIADLEGVNDD